MRVLSVGADRSKRGILYPDSTAYARQKAYAEVFGNLDIIALSRRGDGQGDIHDGPLCVLPTSSSSRLSYFFDALRIARKLTKPDVVSAQDPFETGLIAWRIARRRGAPLHIQVHTDFLSPEYARHSLLNRLRVHLARFILKRATRIRVVSERIRRSLISRFNLDIQVTVLPIFTDVERVRNAVPDPACSEKTSGFETKILIVARLEPEKNVARAIEAFAVSAPPDACLVIVGDGSERAKLERLVRERGISGRVFFEGERDAASYYPLADLVLVPSLYEGYGIIIIEALTAGKPVLSTDIGIAREAGAIITTPDKFSEALAQWFKEGPRTGILNSYPYKNFDEYVHAYCDDIAVCVNEA